MFYSSSKPNSFISSGVNWISKVNILLISSGVLSLIKAAILMHAKSCKCSNCNKSAALIKQNVFSYEIGEINL